MESRGLDRRSRSYPQTKSAAARTGGRQSWRASMDGGPTGAEDCAGSGLVGSEVRIGVQGATTSLVMTRVKHHSWSWVGVTSCNHAFHSGPTLDPSRSFRSPPLLIPESNSGTHFLFSPYHFIILSLPQ